MSRYSATMFTDLGWLNRFKALEQCFSCRRLTRRLAVRRDWVTMANIIAFESRPGVVPSDVFCINRVDADVDTISLLATSKAHPIAHRMRAGFNGLGG